MHLRIKVYYFIYTFSSIKFLASLLGIGAFTNIDTK